MKEERGRYPTGGERKNCGRLTRCKFGNAPTAHRSFVFPTIINELPVNSHKLARFAPFCAEAAALRSRAKRHGLPCN